MPSVIPPMFGVTDIGGVMTRRKVTHMPHTFRSEYESFRRVFDAVTIPAPHGGRRVPDRPGAVALSEAVGRFYPVLAMESRRLMAEHGDPVDPEKPCGGVTVQLMESDSPDGPWTPVPSDAITASAATIGADGIPAMSATALNRLMTILAFPPGREDRGHRYFKGDVFNSDEVALIESVAGLLGVASGADTAANKPAPVSPPDPIGMLKALERFNVSRSTLSRAVNNGKLKSYRPVSAPQNAEHVFSEAELDRYYKRHGATERKLRQS